MAELLMPKATAVWLVDNTSLSFDQIAEFCKLHPLEVKAIADGEAAQGIKGLDPISTGQLSRDGQLDTLHRSGDEGGFSCQIRHLLSSSSSRSPVLSTLP